MELFQAVARGAGLAGRGRIERLAGLRKAAQGHPGTHVQDIRTGGGGFAGAWSGLKEAGQLPRALFCSHDGMGGQVVSELHRMGCRVPEDVSVDGHRDFAAALQVLPALSRVRQPGAAMGVAAFRLLIQRMDPSLRHLPWQRLVLVPQIIERDSVCSRLSGAGRSG